MKKVVFGILIFTVVGITIQSCNKEDSITDENATYQTISFDNPNLSQKGYSTMTIEEFLSYVKFDETPAIQFMDENNVDKDSFISYISEKLNEVKDISSESKKGSMSSKEDEKPSLQEIRDAMINECENGYCCGLDDACTAAVKIAYWHELLFNSENYE